MSEYLNFSLGLNVLHLGRNHLANLDIRCMLANRQPAKTSVVWIFTNK